MSEHMFIVLASLLYMKYKVN